MSEYDTGTFGEFWAPYYDDIFKEAAFEVGLLREFAGDPPRALELAIGSGRVALPLSQAGVEVTGIDISDEMISLLRAKPGGEAIEVIVGDFADVGVDETFPLVYLPFNTLFSLMTQERQVECFHNVGEALEPGGRFVLDTFVPDLRRFDHNNTRMGVSSISSNEAHAYEVSIHDPLTQKVVSHQVRRLEDGSTVVLPVTVRYAWPSEMDLMARLAGLRLEHRWAWYDKRAYTEKAGQHVSVYRKPSQ
ncbi:MAG: class I SAM-dependent methyltransferase [Actinobacteria bacterium]|nr:class I SAM-dependent methyltransferase [Actinomycetota bacterium]